MAKRKPGQVTLNEGLALLKTLRERRAELVSLRDANSVRTRRYIGANAEKDTVTEVLYDVKKIDTVVAKIAKTERDLSSAIKATNAVVVVKEFTQPDDVLGEAVDFSKA